MGTFSIIIIALLAFGFYKGYKKGFVHILASVIGLFIAYQFSGMVAGILQNYLQESQQYSILSSKYVSYGLAFVLILILVRVLAMFIVKLLKLLGINFVNKGLGGTLNLIIYGVIISIASHFLTDVNLISKENNKDEILNSSAAVGSYLMNHFFDK